ncbi:hypothetical protein D3C81_1582300 [compost metagenome]
MPPQRRAGRRIVTERPGAGEQRMQHGQPAVGMAPQRLSLQVDRGQPGHHRPHALGQQIQKCIHATTGQAGQRVTLLGLPRQRRGIVISPPRPLDTLPGLVPHGHQQGRLAGGQFGQLLAVQRAERSIAVEHPQHRVPRCWRRAVRLTDP